MKNFFEWLDEYLYSDYGIASYIINYLRREKNKFIFRQICNNKKGGGQNLSELKVQNGPFKDMKYYSFNSVGSALFPKLLGSYEKELHKIINLIKENEYSEIIDIGCAEGYYAIGFAYLAKAKNFKTKVYAYDIDIKARVLCSNMARVNFVKDRITIRNKCTSDTLKNFKFTGKNLIISDCEGYERELFNNSVTNNLKNSDILIEVHDFDMSKNYKISNFEYLIKLFRDTHKYEIIYSIDDYEKVYRYKYKELSNLNNQKKFFVLAEGRPCLMKWLFFTPINQ